MAGCVFSCLLSSCYFWLRVGWGGQKGAEEIFFLLANDIVGELCLCCGCLEPLLSLRGPFCRFFRDISSPISGDFLPPVSLVWLPHSLFLHLWKAYWFICTPVCCVPLLCKKLLLDKHDIAPYVSSWCVLRLVHRK